MFTKVGSITVPTSTGNQAITGVGFQPKAVLFWTTETAADGNELNLRLSWGVAVSSTERWTSGIAATDGAVTSGRVFKTTKCISVVNDTPTVQIEADFVSMDSDGFTINWGTVQASSRQVFYMAIGGSEISAKAGYWDTASSTGNQAITGVGFQPDLLLFAQALDNTTEPGANYIWWEASMAKSSSSRGLLALTGSGDGVTIESKSALITSKILRNIYAGTTYTEADFVSMDADGFTINNSTITQKPRVGYLALRGTLSKIGTFVENTSTGNQAITGVGFQPQAVLFLSRSKATGTTNTASARAAIGAATSSSARWSIAADRTESNPYLSDRRTQSNKVLTHLSAGTPTVDAEADFVSNDPDGFTINMTTADATARDVLYLALTSVTLTLSVSDNITVTENAGRMLQSYVNKSESITVTESYSLSGLGAGVTLSVNTSESVSLSENIGRLLTSFTNRSDSIIVKETVSYPFDRAIYFNGSSDYLTASMAPATTGFNIAFWLNVEALGNNEYLFDVTGGSNNGFRFIRSAGVNVKNLYFQVFNTGSNVAQIAYTSVSAFKPMHVVATFAPNSAKLYVDKVLIGTDTSCTIGTFDGTFEIGRRNTSASYMKMALDRMVWQNTATPWSQSDVDNLYDFSTIPSGASYWDFDNNLTDLSGNGETLTVGSGTSYIASPMATISVVQDYAVNVSDSVTITESTGFLEESYVNKSESITVTESTTVQPQSSGTLFVSVSESIIVTENKIVSLICNVDAQEDITVSDIPRYWQDTVYVFESYDVEIVTPNTLFKAVSDSITITENSIVRLLSFVDKSESITLSESISVKDLITISTSDSITVSESKNLLEISYVVESESISISENKNVAHTFTIQKSESITLSESIGTNPLLYITESESITVSEIVTEEEFTNSDFETDLSGWYAGKLPEYDTDTKYLFRPEGLSGYSNSDPITSWTDDSGNSNTVTEATNTPIKVDNQVNGHAIVRFDGTNDVLTKASPSNLPSGAANRMTFTVAKTASAGTTLPIIGYGAGATGQVWQQAFWSTNLYYWGYFNDFPIDSNNVTNAFHIFATMYNGTNIIHDTDGAQRYNSVNGGVNTTPSTLKLGSYPPNAAYFTPMDFAESFTVADYNTTDRHLYESYLALKYGLTLTERGANITRDTGTFYSGSASAKVVAIDTTPFFQMLNPGSGTFTLIAYVKTDGNPVTSSDAELFYNGSAITTTYTSVGSGWYELSANISHNNTSRSFGVEVKSGKTAYIDSVNFTAGNPIVRLDIFIKLEITTILSDDLSSSPTGTLSGTALYDSANDWVTLIAGQSNSTGTLQYSNSILRTNSFLTTFDWYRSGSADGTYFFWGSTSLNSGGYSVWLDFYNNRVVLFFNGSTVSIQSPITMPNAATVQVAIKVKYLATGTQVDVKVNGQNRFSYTDIVRTQSGDAYGWSAFNGGQTSTQTIDNLLIEDISRVEDIWVTESTNFHTDKFINKSENISVSENRVLNLIPFISRSESITVSENKTIRLLSFIQEAESVITVDEVPRLAFNGSINSADFIIITENKNLELTINIDVEDSISVSEVVMAERIFCITLSETITVSESFDFFTLPIPSAVDVDHGVGETTGIRDVELEDSVSIRNVKIADDSILRVVNVRITS